MLFHSWLRTLRTVLTLHGGEGKRGRAPHRQPPALFRPRLEVLEDRLTPTTIPVTATSDPFNNGSLLESAIEYANAGDTIALSAGTYTDAGVTNQYSIIPIPIPLTITGVGSHLTVIDQQREFAGFLLSSSNVIISNLKIENAVGGNGAGIYNTGNLTIDNCILSGNYANSQGGGIDNLGGTVVIKNSTLTGNAAQLGGAIATIGGSLTMTNCTVNGNTAYQYGGGMYVDPAVVTIIGSTFSGNFAAAGTDLYNLASSVTLIGSSVPGIYNNGGTITDPIANILAQVAALNLTAGETNSLTSKLQAAENSLASANTTAAVNQLNAFLNQVNALVNSHRLSDLTADDLISDVDDLIQLLG